MSRCSTQRPEPTRALSPGPPTVPRAPPPRFGVGRADSRVQRADSRVRGSGGGGPRRRRPRRSRGRARPGRRRRRGGRRRGVRSCSHIGPGGAPGPVHRSTTGRSVARVIAVIGLARPSPVALTSASLRVQVRKNAAGPRPSRARSTGERTCSASASRSATARTCSTSRPTGPSGRTATPTRSPAWLSENPGTVREDGLAVLGPAAAGAVEDERPGPTADQRCEDEPRERVRGEVARPVGGPAEAGEAVALVVVEQADQRRCGLWCERGRPPDRAALRGWHGRDATQDRHGQAPPGRAGRPPPRAPAARLRVSPSGGRG